MHKAFVLGAGLGTRLRPLTDQLPKPLIPVFHRPLITYAFDHLARAGVREFIVNTHHLPGRYAEAFPDSRWRDCTITFRHEPVLLETAGGIANIADLVEDEPFLVYNGDILTDLPLAPLLATHQADENIVTLALRSDGPVRNVAFDAETGLVSDLRGLRGTGDAGSFQFTGIYAVSPRFLPYLAPGKIESVVPVFLKLIELGMRVGAVVVDEGQWWDLGDRTQYLAAHQALARPGRAFPASQRGGLEGLPAVSAAATVHPQATLLGLNVISDGAVVAAGATVEDCILWPEARVAAGASLRSCIVRSGMEAAGMLADTDV